MTQSSALAPGRRAADFSLPDPQGRRHSLADFAAAEGLVVVFICNHCPYVKHMLDGLVKYAKDYASRSIAVVAISSNDVEHYPEDSPAKMGLLAQQRGFTFPYLYDASQEVALDYQAVCTPDFFLLNRQREIIYRGQFDSSRPRSELPVTGEDLRAATEALLAGRRPGSQLPSVGCSIKWKPGNGPG